MERIYLKPVSKEILYKNPEKEGHLDLFSYNYEADDPKRKLGGLYMVGNVQMPAGRENPDDNNDVTYITNLVASLAKREYYANTDLAPKDAFSLALKKINEVVEEFFTSKDIRINIGIFAIAGEQINISKLGKFKIILSRDGKNIDILNNIDLFTKERVQEKEFSHVISGKISEGDKILAFYPGRLITARERYIKDYLLKYNGDQLEEKLNSIKQDKPEFACAALYIDMNKTKEPTAVPKVKTSPLPSPKPELAPEQNLTPNIRLASEPENTVADNDLSEAVEKESRRNRTEAKKAVQPSVETEVEVPRIIRAEFSLGKKQNLINMSINKLKPFMPRFQNKLAIFLTVIGIIVVSAFVVKSAFILSPGERNTASAIEQAEESLKLAKTKITQNDILGARQLLTGSLSALASADISNSKAEKTKDEVMQALDNLDQAVELSPSLVESLPEAITQKITSTASVWDKLSANAYNINAPVAFDIYENNLYAITADNIFKVSDINQSGKKESSVWLKSGSLPTEPKFVAVDGKIYVMNYAGVLDVYFRGERTAEYKTSLLSDDKTVIATTKDSKYLYLINKNLARIYLIDKNTGILSKTLKFGSSEPITEAYLGEDETIYFTTADNRLWKIK